MRKNKRRAIMALLSNENDYAMRHFRHLLGTRSYPEGAGQRIVIEDGTVRPGGSWCDTATALAYFRQKKISPKAFYTRHYVSHPPALANLINARASAKRNAARAPLPMRQRMMEAELKPSLFKWDRALGVEIECFGPSVEKYLPISCRETQDGSLMWESIDRSTMPVGSEPREYRVLCRRADFEVRLHHVCRLLRGHKVNKTCGLHVHMDMRGRSFEQVRDIARKIDHWLSALVELQPRSRRDNRYCRAGISSDDRYRRVNITSFNKHSTLEVRFGAGTTDPEKIIAWVRLLELLVAMPTAPKPIYRGGDKCIAALALLPLCEYERGFWLTRHRVLNPEQYTANQAASNDEGEGR
jgi:hypothetical protein